MSIVSTYCHSQYSQPSIFQLHFGTETIFLAFFGYNLLNGLFSHSGSFIGSDTFVWIFATGATANGLAGFLGGRYDTLSCGFGISHLL
jgi:hypothetical protein